MTMTARYADIVLPSTTYLETEDFYRSYGSYYMQYAPRAVEPQGEAWSNLRFAQTMAQRMGLKDGVFRLPESDLVHELFRGAGGVIGGMDPATIIAAGPVKLAPSDAQTFATPSGKLEIYSETLHAMGVDPMPDWRPDPEEQRDALTWPLRLLTAPGYFQAHTAFEGVEFLKRRQGPVACIMHPADTASRGLVAGDVVRLRNHRAQIRMTLHVSDEVQPGVVLVPGQRTDPDEESGTVNMLCADRYTDMGEGATYQSTFLEVTKWDAVAA